ncbi:hypothetical protein WAF17_13000 [Bernardetia sp. ABR2-2B]|uniref:hypothetical protein n=1 Tax=Bernardetia sp. ABR2-2B TaxID=3127472 RepID=UPI0030D4E4A3
MNTPKYYYRIQELLQKLPQDEAKATIKLLEEKLGKSRVTKHRYYKTDTKIHVIMRVEEALIYKEVFELESTELLLSTYTKKQNTRSHFDKIGIRNF